VTEVFLRKNIGFGQLNGFTQLFSLLEALPLSAQSLLLRSGSVSWLTFFRFLLINVSIQRRSFLVESLGTAYVSNRTSLSNIPRALFRSQGLRFRVLSSCQGSLMHCGCRLTLTFLSQVVAILGPQVSLIGNDRKRRRMSRGLLSRCLRLTRGVSLEGKGVERTGVRSKGSSSCWLALIRLH
jgi:hypothetical protein